MSRTRTSERMERLIDHGIEGAPARDSSSSASGGNRVLLAVFALTYAVTIVGGIAAYQSTLAKAELERIGQELQIVETLKREGIRVWLGERQADAENLGERRDIIDAVERIRAGDASAVTDGLSLLRTLMSHGDYDDIGLVSPDGEVLLAATAPHSDEGRLLHLFDEADPPESESGVIAVDLHRGPDGAIQMGYLTPLLDPDDRSPDPIGYAVLLINPETYLYPYLADWPTTSSSGETLFFRHEGEDVLFLNELRHQTDTALRLTLPVDSPTLPAAIVFRTEEAGGEQVLLEGDDYRGERVFAVGGDVPGTPWFLLAKIDASEALEPTRRSAWAMIAIGALLLGVPTPFAYALAIGARDRRIREAIDADLRRANAELYRANQAKSEFLAAMSHELRTPLNSIIGFTGIMLDGLAGGISGEQERQLRMVKSSGQRLLALVNDVLDLAKIEAGRQQLQVTEFTANRALEHVRHIAVHAADQKGLVFQVREPVPDIRLATDLRAVEQILVNLTANAVKFTDTGEVSLTVHARGDDRVAFEVSDTGPGIPESSITDIFEPFSQAGRAAASDRLGTGLGLAISNRLAERLGGELRVASVVGQGSTFTLEVPAVAPHPD